MESLDMRTNTQLMRQGAIEFDKEWNRIRLEAGKILTKNRVAGMVLFTSVAICFGSIFFALYQGMQYRTIVGF